MKHEDNATIYEILQREHGVNVEKEIVVSVDLSAKLFLHQKNYFRLEASSMRGSYWRILFRMFGLIFWFGQIVVKSLYKYFT